MNGSWRKGAGRAKLFGLQTAFVAAMLQGCHSLTTDA
jgi:hypothetical protein